MIVEGMERDQGGPPAGSARAGLSDPSRNEKGPQSSAAPLDPIEVYEEALKAWARALEARVDELEAKVAGMERRLQLAGRGV